MLSTFNPFDHGYNRNLPGSSDALIRQIVRNSWMQTYQREKDSQHESVDNRSLVRDRNRVQADFNDLTDGWFNEPTPERRPRLSHGKALILK